MHAFWKSRRALSHLLCFQRQAEWGEKPTIYLRTSQKKMSNKTGQRYSETIAFMRNRLPVDLLKTTIIALRGYRGKRTEKKVEIMDLDINLETTAEGSS